MAIMRKLASVSTLGAVKYTSRREAQTKAASAQAREARAETKLPKEQTKEVKAGTNAAKPSFREIPDAGKMQRAAKRPGVKMTMDECDAAVREVNRAEGLMTSGAGRGG